MLHILPSSYNLRNCSMFSFDSTYSITIRSGGTCTQCETYLKLLHFPTQKNYSFGFLALIFAMAWWFSFRRLMLPLRLYVRSSATIVNLDFRFMLLILPPIHKLLCQSTLDIKRSVSICCRCGGGAVAEQNKRTLSFSVWGLISIYIIALIYIN